MQTSLDLFTYSFINNNASQTLFLLHGTGGSKDDFLFLDTLLDKSYNLLGIQGNIDENGLARFFKRSREGVFDQDSIKEESKKLYYFVSAFKEMHPQLTQTTRYLGYSNGANMLLATSLLHPQHFKNIFLLHAMLPFPVDVETLDLSEHTIFLSHGLNDPMITKTQQQQLNDALLQCNAQLTVHQYNAGHEITPQEVKDITTALE